MKTILSAPIVVKDCESMESLIGACNRVLKDALASEAIGLKISMIKPEGGPQGQLARFEIELR